ncbi:PAS domain-containing protein [Aurantibacter crassamenti]|uniref:LuxR C-terminal-related transcriptional regulator n=1 Tax=Aurantibacter crassamenti TaxID=1837375 RepID=UPI0019396096|nr:LuxR C-terminal-related transcriptional regulator [Aurantibacter crassamenti]MBM1105428.1 PAS domain-containing protein [Aurantibacter crassamenti]
MKKDHKNEMFHFRKKIEKIVKKYDYEPVSYEPLETFPLNSKQCLYVAHWYADGIIYQRGLENLTGYTLEEFNMEDLVHHIHPEDRELVKNITQEVVKHVINVNLSEGPAHLFLSFRFRKKDGTYIKLLRQSSSFELDKEGRMVSNFSLLTDISFIDSSNRVEWSFEANELDLQNFKNIVYTVYQDYFTTREREIIELIAEGYTSGQIAEKLFISIHTVATHRKKILKKAGVSNGIDLIFFCKKNGIL